MSSLLAVPGVLAAAAADLAGIESELTTAHAAAAAPTTGVLAAAGDEVSAQIAAVFSRHAQWYQRVGAQAAAFHQQFAKAVTAGANAYAGTEANAAQLLAAVGKPAEMVLGHSLLLSGGEVSGFFSSALHDIEGVLSGGGSRIAGGSAAAAGQFGALLLRPTGGIGAMAAAGALLAPTSAANAMVSIGEAIENAYLAVEPWVQYGFELAAWAVGYLPYIGWLAPQINYFYNLFEPIVQSVLFNTVDFLDGTVGFVQGLNNISAATTASINQFITTEIYWIRSFFPPFPPIGSLVMPTPPS